MSEDISLRLPFLGGVFVLSSRFIEIDKIIDDKFLDIVESCRFEQVFLGSLADSSSD